MFRSGTIWHIRDFARHHNIGGLFVGSPAFFQGTSQIRHVRAPIPGFSGNRGGNSRKRDINSSKLNHFHVGNHETLFGCIWTAKREGGRVLACLCIFSQKKGPFDGLECTGILRRRILKDSSLPPGLMGLSEPRREEGSLCRPSTSDGLSEIEEFPP
jgi:hypothetical protein